MKAAASGRQHCLLRKAGQCRRLLSSAPRGGVVGLARQRCRHNTQTQTATGTQVCLGSGMLRHERATSAGAGKSKVAAPCLFLPQPSCSHTKCLHGVQPHHSLTPHCACVHCPAANRHLPHLCMSQSSPQVLTMLCCRHCASREMSLTQQRCPRSSWKNSSGSWTAAGRPRAAAVSAAPPSTSAHVVRLLQPLLPLLQDPYLLLLLLLASMQTAGLLLLVGWHRAARGLQLAGASTGLMERSSLTAAARRHGVHTAGSCCRKTSVRGCFSSSSSCSKPVPLLVMTQGPSCNCRRPLLLLHLPQTLLHQPQVPVSPPSQLMLSLLMLLQLHQAVPSRKQRSAHEHQHLSL